MRKILFYLGLIGFIIFTPLVLATETKTPITIFERADCTHCQDEKKFLEKLEKERNDFQVFYHNIEEKKHAEHFEKITKLEHLPKATPITIVGNMVIQGFDTSETTGKKIIQLLEASRGKKTFNYQEFIEAGGSNGNIEKVEAGICADGETECKYEPPAMLIRIPIIGKVIDVAPYSLPTMSILLGFIDGFNPCAMWVLVTFLIVLLQIGHKARMWQIAGLFILSEAIMYFLILNVWYTTWDFVGLDKLITPVVGLMAIGGGGFFLYEGITSDGACQVTNLKQRQKIHLKIKDIAAQPMTIVTVLGVITLALSVNVIEFACSIGIPQAFTKIIEINHLSALATQGLMGLYILFYMLDDVLVFGLALWSVDKLHLTQKYSKASNIIGGILMGILGYLLIFEPGLLNF